MGASDPITLQASVAAYVEQLTRRAQAVEFKVYPNYPHSFLANGGSAFVENACFGDVAPVALDDMAHFIGRYR